MNEVTGSLDAGADTSASPEPSLRDELASAFDSAETSAAGSGTTDTATAQAPDAPGSSPGKQPVGGDQSASPQPLEVPQHWKDADKALFAKAPPEIQQRWIERETEQQKGVDAKFQEVASYRKEREEIDQIFQPFAREMELNGVSRTAAINQLVAAHRFLMEKPLEATKWLLQSYKVDPEALIASLTGEDGQTADPNFKTLENNFLQLSSKLDGFLEQQTKAQHEKALTDVTLFAEAKDEKTGKPLHPYFDEVADEVLLLMRADKRSTLNSAYGKALRMNETVWAKIQAESASAQQQKDEQERKERVEKAKRAAVGSDASGANGAAQPKTLREDLESAFSNYQ